MTTSTRRRRTVFDLTPQELHELREINLAVMATVPPARPRRGPAYDSYSEYAFDYGIYERYQERHALAKQKRAEWIRAHRINRQVVLQAIRTDYKPYAHADRVGLVAPPMPEGYEQAMLALNPPRPAPKPLPDAAASPGGPMSFSF